MQIDETYKKLKSDMNNAIYHFNKGDEKSQIYALEIIESLEKNIDRVF
jgi:hypothetical protein